jgi:6-pyruvoyl-tetrahydropterin synthase
MITNLTPKEKAYELIRLFAYQIKEKQDNDGFIANIEHAKLHAISFVDVVLKTTNLNVIFYSDYKNNVLTEYTQEYYWQQVKKEIEKL